MQQQEIIEHDVRVLIGDLQLQLISARARVMELEAMLASHNQQPPAQPNGLDQEAAVAASPPH